MKVKNKFLVPFYNDDLIDNAVIKELTKYEIGLENADMVTLFEIVNKDHFIKKVLENLNEYVTDDDEPFNFEYDEVANAVDLICAIFGIDTTEYPLEDLVKLEYSTEYEIIKYLNTHNQERLEWIVKERFNKKNERLENRYFVYHFNLVK